MVHRAAVLVVAVLAAGCLGAPAPPASPDPAPEAMVQGRVVDAELLPLADARVHLQDEPAFQTRTDPTGRFALAGVPAGRHTLEAVKDGFVPRRVGIDAEDGGNVTGIEILLVPEPPPAPTRRLEATSNAGFLACGVSFLAPDVGRTAGAACAGDANHRPTHAFRVDDAPGLVALVLELDWYPTTGATSRQLEQSWGVEPKCEGGRCIFTRHLGAAVAGPPVYAVYGSRDVPLAGLFPAADVVVLHAAAALAEPDAPEVSRPGVVWQQPIMQYASVFYHGAPDGAYSAVPAP